MAPVAVTPEPAAEIHRDPWNEKRNIAVGISSRQEYISTEASEYDALKSAVVEIAANNEKGAVQPVQAALTYEPKFELESRAIDEFRPLKVCFIFIIFNSPSPSSDSH